MPWFTTARLVLYGIAVVAVVGVVAWLYAGRAAAQADAATQRAAVSTLTDANQVSAATIQQTKDQAARDQRALAAEAEAADNRATDLNQRLDSLRHAQTDPHAPASPACAQAIYDPGTAAR